MLNDVIYICSIILYIYIYKAQNHCAVHNDFIYLYIYNVGLEYTENTDLFFFFGSDAPPAHVNISSGCIFNAQILAFLSVKQ